MTKDTTMGRAPFERCADCDVELASQICREVVGLCRGCSAALVRGYMLELRDPGRADRLSPEAPTRCVDLDCGKPLGPPPAALGLEPGLCTDCFLLLASAWVGVRRLARGLGPARLDS